MNSFKVILPSWGCPEPQNNSLQHRSWYVYCSPESWGDGCGYMINANWKDNTGNVWQLLHSWAAQPHLLDKGLFMLFPYVLTLPCGLQCAKHSFSLSVLSSREKPLSFPPSLSGSSGTIRSSPGLFEWNPSRPQALPSSQQTASVFQRVHPTVSVVFKIS